MFQKYKFNSYYILTTLLVVVLGLYLDLWWVSKYNSFPSAILALQITALGVYSLFIENELLNTHPYYQIFIIALINGYGSVKSLEFAIDWRLKISIRFLNLIWALLAIIIHKKFPNLLLKIFRFNIGFTLFYIIMRHISVVPVEYFELISSILALSFVFISYLTFDRVTIYTSIYLYAYMIVVGIMTVINEIPIFTHYYRYIIGNILVVLIFFTGSLYYRYKQSNSQGDLLHSDQPTYNSVGSEV